MKRHVGVVWNPSKVDESELRSAVSGVFDEGTQLDWWETNADDPGRSMAAAAVAAGCDTVLAVGGDGTVRVVAEALAGTDVSLGIVPQGTGNLLARNLEVPLGDLTAALERARDTQPQSIDLGWVEANGEKHAFAVMVGFGIDAQMLVETDDELKEKAGWLAYVEAMGRAVAGTEMTGVTVIADDAAPHHVRGHTMLIGNCGMVQGGIRLLPDATLDDGLLDALLITSEGALEWFDTVRSVIWDNGIRRLLARDQQAVSTESTRHLTAERLSVDLEEPQPFEIDGEEVGEVSSFTVQVQPRALRVR